MHSMKFMTILGLLLMYSLFSIPHTLAGIEQIYSMIRRADGAFDVQCVDQTKEVASIEQIKQNQVCVNAQKPDGWCACQMAGAILP